MGITSRTVELEEEPSRDNGWSCPPHPLQIVAWLTVIAFAIIHNTCLVPALPTSWQPAGYIIPNLALIGHVICHIVASTINPADEAVLRKKDDKRAAFDRTKHEHVIENCHCYICEVDVESRSKHCSVCNKCISSFDHHCKWLNNCVGGRNYRWFLATLITGIIGLLLVVIVALAEFIAYYTDRDNRAILQPFIVLESAQNYTDAELKLFHQTVIHEGWLSLVGITFSLGIIGVALLVHLFGFHCYLMYKGLSTYDYIVQQRDREHEKEIDDEVASISSSTKRSRKNQITPTALDKRKAMALDKNMHKHKHSRDSKASIISTAMNGKDYQKMFEDAERQTEAGETPPPSTSPIHMHEHNNNNYQKSIDEKTAVKRLKKKKKTRKSFPNETTSEISTVDNLQMYQNKGYAITNIQVPSNPNPVRIMPPPIVTPKGSGHAGDYNSDTADSLLEVPTDKSLSMSTKGSEIMHYTTFSKLDSQEKKDVSERKKKVKKKKKVKTRALDSDDELNNTTMFTVNSTAKKNLDGSLDYSSGFSELPLTPSTLRRKLPPAEGSNSPEVPPLDFSGLRGSSESISFQPYSATFRSTDTHGTDRLLPVLREEKIKNKLNPVIDTEV